MYFDTHAHIVAQTDTPPETYLSHALEQGVSSIICVGCAPDHLEENITTCIRLSTPTLQLFPSMGIHPDIYNDASISDEERIQRLQRYTHQLEELYRQYGEHIVALGECGLDYYWPHHKQAQHDLFTMHIEKGMQWDLPLIIHTRDAWDDLFLFLERYPNLKGVIHCFSGTVETMHRLLPFPNLMISLAGIVTFPKAQEQFVPVIQELPLTRLLIETDTPYLAPVPMRGKPNMPGYVRYTAEHIAQIRNMTPEEIGAISAQNAKKIFSKTV